MLTTVAPKSWSLDRSYEVAYLAAMLLFEGKEIHTETEYGETRGIFDLNDRKIRLENLQRSEKLAKAYRAGIKFMMVSDCLNRIKNEQEEILASDMRAFYGKI